MSDESKITDPDFQPMSEESKSKGHLLSINSDLRALLAESDAKVKELEAEKSCSKTVWCRHADTNVILETQVAKLETENANLSEENKGLNAEVNTLYKRFDELEKEKAVLTKKLEKARALFQVNYGRPTATSIVGATESEMNNYDNTLAAITESSIESKGE